jgi:hypothetical protein
MFTYTKYISFCLLVICEITFAQVILPVLRPSPQTRNLRPNGPSEEVAANNPYAARASLDDNIGEESNNRVSFN